MSDASQAAGVATDAAGGAAAASAPTPPAGEGAAAFRESLPEDLRANIAFDGVTGLENLARQYADQQAFLGTAIRPPGPDASAEDKQAFYAKLLEKTEGTLMPTPDRESAEAMGAVYDALGRPAAAADYVRPSIDGAPEVDAATDEAYATFMHEQGLTQGQFQALYGFALQRDAQLVSDRRGLAEAEREALRQEWGYTFEPKLESVVALFKQFDIDDDAIAAITNGMAGQRNIKGFQAMAAQFAGEGGQVAGQPGGAAAGMTPGEAEMQIQEVMNKPEYSHHDIKVRQPWIDKVQQLQKYASPDAEFSVESLRRGVGFTPPS